MNKLRSRSLAIGGTPIRRRSDDQISHHLDYLVAQQNGRILRGSNSSFCNVIEDSSVLRLFLKLFRFFRHFSMLRLYGTWIVIALILLFYRCVPFEWSRVGTGNWIYCIESVIDFYTYFLSIQWFDISCFIYFTRSAAFPCPAIFLISRFPRFIWNSSISSHSRRSRQSRGVKIPVKVARHPCLNVQSESSMV